MHSSQPLTESDILRDIVENAHTPLSPEIEGFVSNLRFSKRVQRRIRSLLRANSSGRITDVQRAELERFVRVGQFMDLLQAKVRALSSARAA